MTSQSSTVDCDDKDDGENGADVKPGDVASCVPTIACRNDYDVFIEKYPQPGPMAQAYEAHRTARNADKRAILESTNAVVPDNILSGIRLRGEPPEYDPRNCISVWCRPTAAVADLVEHVQKRLLCVVHKNLSGGDDPAARPGEPAYDRDGARGGLWTAPRANLHMTALEVIHSAPPSVTDSQAQRLKPLIKDILRAPEQGAVLVHPILSYDQNALALSFLPAPTDTYTYHHLRRDLARDIAATGVHVEPRYVVPSAHVTIARFISNLSCPVSDLLAEIDDINRELEDWYRCAVPGTEWAVGAERGIECHNGRIWYGAGGHCLGSGSIRAV
ncbi:RNA ligase/cyclic nucleotide phosphodiesterase [Dipodascopsis tothii]|uniref:RNA ligase/cyclic nucleotide phosphodiesterase n=1 Tax=Dipodascopsis tothii TaxID=44089 RepID=UPI0034CE35A3